MLEPQSIRNYLPIEGKLTRLRVFRQDDITGTYLGWLNDPGVMRYSNQRFRQHTQESCHEYLDTFRNGGNLFLAVLLKEDEKYVGTMTVYFSPAHETADMGILIGDAACWGKGIGGDAWSTMLSFLLEKAKVRKVTGGTLGCNLGMRQIMFKSGMIPDGVRVSQELVDGLAQDVLYFAKFSGA